MGSVTLGLLGGCTAASKSHRLGAVPPAETSLAPEWPAFPAKWCGTWSGNCNISKDNDIAMTFRMELSIEPIVRPDGTLPPGPESQESTPRSGDTYTWTITYAKNADDTKPDSPTRQVRPYTLIVRDTNEGAFVIDEGGGLLLPLHEMNGPLYCTFEVGGTTLVARYGPELIGPHPYISVEILSFDARGFTPVGPAQAKVKSGSPQTLQIGALRRHRSQ